MTKAEIVAEIAHKTGIEKVSIMAAVEAFMETIKGNLCKGENVYLRGFGSFIVKRRAEKTGKPHYFYLQAAGPDRRIYLGAGVYRGYHWEWSAGSNARGPD